MKLPWIMTQRWEHLLYLHYRVDEATLRALVPPELALDLCDGSAWVSLIPFRMEHVHLRDVIPIPTTAHFPELNLRTYVLYDGVPGVWFLSIDACSWFSVQIARRIFRLPYYDAAMSFAADADHGFHLTSGRTSHGNTHPNRPGCAMDVRYTPIGIAGPPEPGSIMASLAERYHMYSMTKSGRLMRGDIVHSPWLVQDVDVDVTTQTVLAAAGLVPLGDPLMAYSPGTRARAWLLRRAD
jgi:uncharacterized protein